MAVLGHISTTLTEDILEMLLDESSLSLVSIDNQISGASSVPDAAIRASTSIWFETKTVRKGVDPDQLQRHLMELQSQEAGVQRLVALTPDAEQPPEIDSIDDERLVWANFSQLVDAIESILDRDTGTTEETVAVPTEREAFLLRELVRFIYDEDLVSGKEDRVLVVAARRAWPDYKDYGMYFCQAGRSFKPANHLAFYADGKIKPLIPRITKIVDSIELTEDSVNKDRRLTPEQKQELLLVHEMTHIIQSDWGLNDGVTNTLDGSLTRTALAEGEAVYIEIQYARRYVSTPVNVSTKLARVSRQGDWRRQLIASPYVVGYKYWSNLDTPPTERHRLLKNGPETTAEVLHPSRNVSVPGEPLPPVNIQGTKRGPPNRVGELAIRVALRTNGVRNNRAARAADGWRNDSLAVYDTDEGRLTSWQIRFENRSEAQEFVRAWTAMLHRTGEALGDGEYSVTPSDSQPTLYYDVSMEGEIVHVEMSPARNVITETNTTETERRSFVMLGRIEKASNTLHPHYN